LVWYPGWDSLDSVRTWHTVFEISGIAFLALLVGAEILAFQYGHRKDELTAIAESNAEVKRKNDADAAEARRKTDVAALQKELVEAGKKVAELDRLRAPRHLLPPQQKTLQDLLARAPKLQLVIKAGTVSGDERAYAEEIASVLRGLSWEVRIDNAMFMGTDVSGLWTVVKGTGSEPVPDSVTTFIRALASAGLDIRGDTIGDAGVPTATEVWLNIGRKR
jgi:hypothetical protein